MMLDVKLSVPFLSITRQTPGQKGFWNDCRFFCNINVKRCDYWFVLEGLYDKKKETTICPKENVVFITGEPPTLKTYSREFLHQFAAVITCHKDIDHPKPIFQQSGMPWHIGRRQKNHVNIEFSKNYDKLKEMATIPKTKLLSVISSSKVMSEGHRKRYEFALRLKDHFGHKIDLFGRGINEIEDKWDALADYKYHVALENSAVDDYWTEKLADAFLAGCHPLYYGCPNINRYFAPASLTPIDLNYPERAISVIEECLAQNRFESSKDLIWESRTRVLDRYNLFALIAEYIAADRKNAAESSRSYVKVTIRKEASASNLFYQFKKNILSR